MSNKPLEISQPLTPAEETFVSIIVRLERRLSEQKKQIKSKAQAA